MSLYRNGELCVKTTGDSGGLFPHQLLGAEGSLPCSPVLPEGERLSSCSDQAGQSDSYLISESYGRTTIPLVSTGTRHLELEPLSPDHPSYRESSRYREHHSRLGVTLSQQGNSVVNVLNQLLGPFLINLFMSRTNDQIPVYCSQKPD